MIETTWDRKRVYLLREWVDILRVVYAGWSWRTEVPSLLAEDVVFFTRARARADTLARALNASCARWVVVTDSPGVGVDLDLTERDDLMRFVEQVRGLPYRAAAHERVARASDEDFPEWVKRSVVAGRWLTNELRSQRKGRVFEFFRSLSSPLSSMVAAYYELREQMTPEEVFGATMTYLARVEGDETSREALGHGYRVLVREGGVQGLSARRGLEAVLDLPTWMPTEARVIFFLAALRRGS